MTIFFRRLGIVVVTCLGVVACAPFDRGIVDNLPQDHLKVQSVFPNGNVELESGRVVRLFGLRVPETKAQGDRFISYLTLRLKDQEVTVDDVIAGEPTAVSMVLWERGFVCGNGLWTWDPWARPFDLYQMWPVSRNLLIQFRGALNQDDLDHVDADPSFVESIRRSYPYAIEPSANYSK